MVRDCGFKVKPAIFVIELGEDDPGKCTATKMVEHGFACRVSRVPRGSLLLDPYVDTPISPADAPLLARRGVTVVDASWRKLDEFKYRRVTRGARVRRRLPVLIAVNPAHYGWAYKLSSVEAVAAALYITGFREEAIRLLSLFKWGLHFLDVNSELLEEYSRAKDARGVIRVEARFLSKIAGRSITSEEVPRLIRALLENVGR